MHLLHAAQSDLRQFRHNESIKMISTGVACERRDHYCTSAADTLFILCRPRGGIFCFRIVEAPLGGIML